MSASKEEVKKTIEKNVVLVPSKEGNKRKDKLVVLFSPRPKKEPELQFDLEIEEETIKAPPPSPPTPYPLKSKSR